MGTAIALAGLYSNATLKLIGYAVLFKGMLAGFFGTIVLSVMMVVKSTMGVVPELDPIAMLAEMLGGSTVLGWIMHFIIGSVVWGGSFAFVHSSLPTHNSVTKGIIFGIGAWLVMMLVVMPMAGEGIFGLVIGLAAPVMAFVLHVVFGAVMGLAYEKQISTAQPAG